MHVSLMQKRFRIQLGTDRGHIMDILLINENTIGWTTFYWHWKHITLWLETQVNSMNHQIILWRGLSMLNPSINGLIFRMNNLAVWAWMFLFV
jgi:hypothetical protein